MRGKAFLLAAILIGAGASGWAAGAPGWTDAQIEQKEKALDDLSAKRLAALEAHYKAQAAFETRQWEERKAFEEKLVAERESFLESLKGKPGNEQKSAFNEFSDKQASERKQFELGQKKELEQFEAGTPAPKLSPRKHRKQSHPPARTQGD